MVPLEITGGAGAYPASPVDMPMGRSLSKAIHIF